MNDTTRCAHPPCANTPRPNGYCGRHQAIVSTCAVKGCGNRPTCRGWCNKHYTRWLRHGDPSTCIKVEGHAWPSSSGYLVHRRRTHPLATSEGRVYVHRSTLYDTIGPGWHPCAWCSTPVTWDHNVSTNPTTALVVDHVDNDRQNNDPSNLRASCQSCNSTRVHHPERLPAKA